MVSTKIISEDVRNIAKRLNGYFNIDPYTSLTVMDEQLEQSYDALMTFLLDPGIINLKEALISDKYLMMHWAFHFIIPMVKKYAPHQFYAFKKRFLSPRLGSCTEADCYTFARTYHEMFIAMLATGLYEIFKDDQEILGVFATFNTRFDLARLISDEIRYICETAIQKGVVVSRRIPEFSAHLEEVIGGNMIIKYQNIIFGEFKRLGMHSPFHELVLTCLLFDDFQQELKNTLPLGLRELVRVL